MSPNPLCILEMPSERWPVAPSVSYFQRNSLGPSSHAAVDSALKDLKSCSRRLQCAVSTFQTELHVLERLYYKGKNQHRSSLFWKRVVEVRRYGQRLSEMNISNVLEHLRTSFFGELALAK